MKIWELTKSAQNTEKRTKGLEIPAEKQGVGSPYAYCL
jgi:hypothetical protein